MLIRTSKRIKFGLIALLTCVFFTVSFSANAQTSLPFSITEINHSGKSLSSPQALPLQMGQSAAQIVTLHQGNIERIAQLLALNPDTFYLAQFGISDNIELTARFTETQPALSGGFLLIGKLENSEESSVTLVSTAGVTSAILTDNNQQYHLDQNSEGEYQFSIIDQNQFPLEAPPLLPPLISQAAQNTNEDDPNLQLDSGQQIDVMVVYTDDARAAAGGSTNMTNLINLAVAETNQGFTRSGIIERYRLVHSAEVAFNELNGGSGLDWSVALNNLTYSDGVIDQVLALRDTYAADLVVMIVNDKSYCGMAWLMNRTNFASNAFSLVSGVCATGYYSFAHETGHNMGAHHDRVNNPENGMYAYSHGYWGPNNAFRTIMAYNCSGSGCPRINNWSNPNILYNGIPTGVIDTASNSADNRLTLNNTASYVANFRQSKTPPDPPTNLSLLSRTVNSITFQFTDNSGNESGFKVERSINGDPWIEISSLTYNQTIFTDQNLNCSQNYSYRVRAYSVVGNSDYSNTLQAATLICAPPDIPTAIQVFPMTTSVRLSWQDVENETNYLIEQLQGTPETWTLVSTLGANSTTAQIINLLPGSPYSVRIGVKNLYGTNYGGAIQFTTMNHAFFIPLLKR